MSKKIFSLLSILPFMFANWIFYSLNQSLEPFNDLNRYYPESRLIAERCQDFDAAKNDRSCDEYLNWRKKIISRSHLIISISLVIGILQLLLPLITLPVGQSILDGIVIVSSIVISGIVIFFLFLLILEIFFSQGTFGFDDLSNHFVEFYQK